MATAAALIKAPETVRPFTIAEFIEVAEALPDRKLELINGEIVIMSQPDKRHQKHTGRIVELFCRHYTEISALGCLIHGSYCYFEVPARDEGETAPSNVCPDATISFRDYWDTNRRPPALLVVEVLSTSNRANLERNLVTKPEIYATLEIPTYWIVDRRDLSVRVHTDPRAGEYLTRRKFQGDEILPAPGLEFLQITPALVFADA